MRANQANQAPELPSVKPMRLALFDLDHTLIPFDSGMAFTGWLAAQGVLPADAPAALLAACQKHVDGGFDILSLHRATVAPLAQFSTAELAALSDGFAAHMAPRLLPQRLALVQRHRDAGDHCVLVTATTQVIAQVFGQLFGLHAVLATESAWQDGRLTGEVSGQPCWRAHKVDRVQAWLAGQGLALDQLARSWFYSDSASDLPLLQAVSNPVAVRPDARLRAVALQQGWPVIDD